jgi:hypothetical protein
MGYLIPESFMFVTLDMLVLSICEKDSGELIFPASWQN